MIREVIRVDRERHESLLRRLARLERLADAARDLVVDLVVAMAIQDHKPDWLKAMMRPLLVALQDADREDDPDPPGDVPR